MIPPAKKQTNAMTRSMRNKTLANATPAIPHAVQEIPNPSGMRPKANASAPTANMKATESAAQQGKYPSTAKNAFMNICRKE